MTDLRFSFSNIAWEHAEFGRVASLLRQNGVGAIEVAPTMVWPNWEGASVDAARALRARIEDEGFTISSMQAVLYAKPQARLFDREGERALVEHLSLVARLASALGATVVVFGAPKQRDRGEMSLGEAMDAAVPVLRALGDIFAAEGSCLCIEPNPPEYQCNFIVNSVEGEEIVRRVANSGFALHLDAGAMLLQSETLKNRWSSIADIVRHFHISEPGLVGFSQPRVDHAANLAVLRSGGYDGWCAVEMRKPAAGLAEEGPWQVLQAARPS